MSLVRSLVSVFKSPAYFQAPVATQKRGPRLLTGVLEIDNLPPSVLKGGAT